MLRARLEGGIRNKAARGELRHGQVCFHPDEAVTGVIAAVFERFAVCGPAGATWLWLREQGLRWPLCALYQQRGKPAPRTPLVNSSDLDIVATYGSEYRGIVQYYLLASDVYRLNRLNGVMRTSLLKTLACKHKSTGRKMAARYKAKIETPHGLRTCLQVTVERGNGRKPLVARFGGIPLKRQQKAVLIDRIPERVTYPRKELPLRLLRGECEVCDRTGSVSVHQIRKLTDLGRPGPGQPEWARRMAKRRRKTLVVCAECHHAIHAEHIAALFTAWSPESPLR